MLDVSVPFQDTFGICSVIGHMKKLIFCYLKKHSSFKKTTFFPQKFVFMFVLLFHLCFLIN